MRMRAVFAELEEVQIVAGAGIQEIDDITVGRRIFHIPDQEPAPREGWPDQVQPSPDLDRLGIPLTEELNASSLIDDDDHGRAGGAKSRSLFSNASDDELWD
jgi:hypothetical protein